MRRFLCCLLVFVGAASPLHGQTLRAVFEEMFTFGDCGEPLCLPVNASVHGLHYIPGVTQGQNNLLAFLQTAIATSVTNVPISSGSSGTTFIFRGGIPVRTSTSSGPIFAERAQTLGRGRLLFGANMTGVGFQSVRGVPLEDLTLNFTHQNVGDAAMGVPSFENDVVQVRTSLDVDLIVGTFFASYGLLDRVDIGVAIPYVRTSISGEGFAQVNPGSSLEVHFFGTPTNPSLVATSSAEGTASGIGDIAARMKINVSEAERASVALVGDVRLPTGDEEEFLGSGEVAVRALLAAATRFADVSPHINLGYIHRGGEFQTSSLLTTVGFDHLLAPSVTFALDVIGDWQLGDNPYVLPKPITITQPYSRTVVPTNIPERKDNIVDAALGLRFNSGRSLTLLTNALVALNDGGVRDRLVWTFGLEYNFYPRATAAR